jgi:hypothetical protein
MALGFGTRAGQPGNKVQGLEDDMRGAIGTVSSTGSLLRIPALATLVNPFTS